MTLNRRILHELLDAGVPWPLARQAATTTRLTWLEDGDDGVHMTGHGLDDVDHVPEPNRRRPTSPTPQTTHTTPTGDTTTHTALDT